MIDLFIKSIEKGAEYNDQVYDFWIDAILEDGSEINIFDFSPFDLRTLIGERVACAIELFEISPILNGDGLTVKFLGELDFPKLDYVREIPISFDNLYGFENKNGIFYVGSKEIPSKNKYIIGDEYTLEVARYDLLGYNKYNI